MNHDPEIKQNTLGEDWEQLAIKKAFGLAYFIHYFLSDEEKQRIALEIAKEALRQRPVVSKDQGKRHYYWFNLRNKIQGKARSKINLEEMHLVQLLVFKESEKVEREQEADASSIPLNQEVMLVRYLAYLVGITMGLTSFYVALALYLFVYDYNAEEAAEAYEFVIQGSLNRYKDGIYFRKRKVKFIKVIQGRFGKFLRLVDGSKGEKHFQRVQKPEQFSQLLKDCLSAFQPWDVVCCLPERFNKFDELPMLRFDGLKGDDSYIEMKRMHSLLHPDCFIKLAKAKLGEDPEKRLGLPLFSLSDSQMSG